MKDPGVGVYIAWLMRLCVILLQLDAGTSKTEVHLLLTDVISGRYQGLGSNFDLWL